MDCRSIIRGSIPREPAKICSFGTGGALPPGATIHGPVVQLVRIPDLHSGDRGSSPHVSTKFWFRRFMGEISHRKGKAQFFMPNERDLGPVKTCGFLWGYGTAATAPALQAGFRGFESHYFHQFFNGALASLVGRLPWAQDVGGSNPSAPTKYNIFNHSQILQLVEVLTVNQVVPGPNPGLGANLMRHSNIG